MSTHDRGKKPEKPSRTNEPKKSFDAEDFDAQSQEFMDEFKRLKEAAAAYQTTARETIKAKLSKLDGKLAESQRIVAAEIEKNKQAAKQLKEAQNRALDAERRAERAERALAAAHQDNRDSTNWLRKIQNRGFVPTQEERNELEDFMTGVERRSAAVPERQVPARQARQSSESGSSRSPSPPTSGSNSPQPGTRSPSPRRGPDR